MDPTSLSDERAAVVTGGTIVPEQHADDDEHDLPAQWWHQQQFVPMQPAQYHAHFDCFSGAAGDMMLAACLDAANHSSTNSNTGNIEEDVEDSTLTAATKDSDQGARKLLRHIVRCLRCSLPDLADEFDVHCERVWRGSGSITALHVQVDSIYQHRPVSVPPPRRRPPPPISTSKDDGDASAGAGAHPSPDHHHHHHEHDHAVHLSLHSHTHHEHSDLPTAKPVTGPTVDNLVDYNGQVEDHSHAHSHDHSPEALHHHDHEHSPNKIRNLPDIRQMLQAPSALAYLPPWVRDRALETFTALARAEAAVHGAASWNEVHFHEVGAVDSLVDTIGTLVALFCLHVPTVSCSRLPLGEGCVRTAHGILPVPAPATLQLMMDLPTTPGPPGVTGELVTPTGAALLRTLILGSRNNITNNTEHSSIHLNAGATTTTTNRLDGRPPQFTLRKVGVGAGTKDFAQHPNVIRLLLGDTVMP